MPLTVVGLDVEAAVVEARLRGDPNVSRADDLAVALAELGGDGREATADWRVPADRPVAAIADDVLRRLGWLDATDPAAGSRVILGRPGAVG